MDVLLRLRKKTRHPEKGSVWSFSRHNRASESIPFRPSTASTATRIRMWGAIWIIGPPLSRRAAGRPNPAACPSSRHASSRWRTPDPLQPRPVPWRAPTVPRRLAPPIEAHFDGTPLRATSASSNACSPYATPWLWGAVHTVLPCRPPLPRTLAGGVIEKFACYAIVPDAASVAINRRELLLSRGTCPTVQLTAGSSHARLPKGHGAFHTCQRLERFRSLRLRPRPRRRALHHGQRRQCGGHRRSRIRGGEGVLSAVLHDALDGHRRRDLRGRQSLSRSRFVRGGDQAPVNRFARADRWVPSRPWSPRG